jgi:hypothetical protein
MNRRIVAMLVLVALVAAACSVARPSRHHQRLPEDGSRPTRRPPPSRHRSARHREAPTEAPTEPPTDEPVGPDRGTDRACHATPASGEPAAPAGADVCTGTQDNRDFFENVARDLDWTVLCAVLPRGWVVQSGSYRLANGGRMLISYKSRAGGTLALSEGAFCQSADGCVPAGSDVGDAAYGPMTGAMVALDDGGWAIVVDRGAELSWLLEAHGVDEATATAFGAALAVVEG